MTSESNQILVTDVNSFIRAIINIKRIDQEFAFRGHDDVSYKSIPSVFRKVGWMRNEEHLISEVTRRAPSDFLDDKLALDVLVRVQHYGLPTRLLDVSLNPLVALFFASDKYEKDGSVLVFGFRRERVKFYDSDAISCVCNSSRLTYDEKASIREYVQKYSGDLDKISQLDFNNLPAVKRLLHFIRSEKSYFLPIIRPRDMSRHFLVKPKLNNRRIVAQHGAFVVSGIIREIRENYPDNVSVMKIVVGKMFKKNIRRELEMLGISIGSLFPDIDRVSEYIKDRYQGPQGSEISYP